MVLIGKGFTRVSEPYDIRYFPIAKNGCIDSLEQVQTPTEFLNSDELINLLTFLY